MFSTHYHELTSLEESLPNLRNLHVEAISENNTIIFMHKVKVGPTDQSYGINVASLAKMPEEVILRATDILNKLSSGNQVDKDILSINNYQKPIIIDKRNPVETSVIDEIRQKNIDELKPLEALLYLSSLKEKLGEE